MYRPWLQCVFPVDMKNGVEYSEREEMKGALVQIRTRTNCEVKVTESIEYIKTKFNETV